MRLIDADSLKEEVNKKKVVGRFNVLSLIDAAPTVIWCSETSEGYPLMDLRPRKDGECRTCRHRDPEDKKCDCGGQERQGCPFPVSDDYYCKFYEKGGKEC